MTNRETGTMRMSFQNPKNRGVEIDAKGQMVGNFQLGVIP
jgi:hypothetical protein